VKVRVADCANPLTSDIDLAAHFDAGESDKTVNRCVGAVTDSLECESTLLTRLQRWHLIQVFLSMRHAHRAIRKMLRSDGSDPAVVNVMSLVRGQLETLFAICLLVEDPGSLSVYLKDGWRKLYVRHILTREEGHALPRVVAALKKQELDLEQFRVASGVTIIEQLTVDEEELGIVLPPGVVREKIAQFPTPAGVLDVVRDPDRRKMLKRLYPEYQFLCGYVHFSPASRILATILDDRHALSKHSTSGQKYEIFQKEILSAALGMDLLCIVQSCCEFIAIYPGHIELAKAGSDGWEQVAKNWLLGQTIWRIRAKAMLGALTYF